MKFTLAALATFATAASAFTQTSSFTGSNTAIKASNGSNMDMRYKVAVIGGGPSGACAAEIFAQEKGIDTVMFERKMDNAKPCGGAIPLCMVGEFDIPETVVDRKVRRSIRLSQHCNSVVVWRNSFAAMRAITIAIFVAIKFLFGLDDSY